MTTKCNGLRCKSTRLISAHIIPRAFARMHKNSRRRHNLELNLSRVKPAQLGIFDKNILCGSCDGLLGKFDEYLCDVIRQFDLSKCTGVDGIFVDNSVDCDAFCKGVLAILCRASISKHRAYSSFSLGKYEWNVRDVLFGARSLAELTYLEVFVQYYQSTHMGGKVKFFYILPTQTRFNGRNGFALSLNGFRIVVKFDERDIDPILQPFAINRQNVFRGSVVELEETTEFAGLRDIAVAELHRQRIREQKGTRSRM